MMCVKKKSSPETKSVKVIMLTAMSGKADREKGLMEGADGYIVKPFSPSGLIDKLQEVLSECEHNGKL